jgi:hypothetical protein
MGLKRMKLGVFTMIVISGATLLGAMLGRAQSTFPVRFDDGTEAAATVNPSWAKMGGIQLEPQDKPPVQCNAANVGFLYIQRDTQGNVPSPQVNTGFCYCTSCVDNVFCDGSTGYADAGYWWGNAAGHGCANLWIPEP